MVEFAKTPPAFKGRENGPSPTDAPLQKTIERMMKDVLQLGSYDAIFLFDAEGLPMAKQIAHIELLPEPHAVELSVLIGKMQKVIRRMSALGPLREVLIEDTGGRKLIFRYLSIFSQIAILVLVVPPHRTYRGLVNRLCRSIEKLSSFAGAGETSK